MYLRAKLECCNLFCYNLTRWCYGQILQADNFLNWGYLADSLYEKEHKINRNSLAQFYGTGNENLCSLILNCPK